MIEGLFIKGRMRLVRALIQGVGKKRKGDRKKERKKRDMRQEEREGKGDTGVGLDRPKREDDVINQSIKEFIVTGLVNKTFGFTFTAIEVGRRLDALGIAADRDADRSEKVVERFVKRSQHQDEKDKHSDGENLAGNL